MYILNIITKNDDSDYSDEFDDFDDLDDPLIRCDRSLCLGYNALSWVNLMQSNVH